MKIVKFAPHSNASALRAVDLNAGTAMFRYTGLFGSAQAVQEGGELTGWNTQPLPPETELWETRDVILPLSSPHPPRWFYRLRQNAWSQP